VRIALAGDTMLGRGVAQRLSERGPPLFAPEIAAEIATADLFFLNLECCVSDRGHRWSNPDKMFFFRAPPAAADVLGELGVDCVTLANNHALDFGSTALADTIDNLTRAGIATVGAGANLAAAREPAVFEVLGLRLAIIGVTDHPGEFAARQAHPGVAYADLRSGVDDWLIDLVRGQRDDADVVVVSPHWGPNMTSTPPRYVRTAAETLVRAGATVIAGHSAHVCHGIAPPVLFDLGDFIDDYAVHPLLRNDLSLLFLLTVDEHGPVRIDAMPIALDYGHTRAANSAEHQWISQRFTSACAEFGTTVDADGARLVIHCR
jgi:poly-gamma-glutamate capsule biosynthesis protein CapA/YwtB (metallophosphatase superfamily)